MSIEAQQLGTIISSETALRFKASTSVDSEGRKNYILYPYEPPSDHTFSIRAIVEWRRLRMEFTPGTFAGELIADMGRADETGRVAFWAILQNCSNRGAQVNIEINGHPHDLDESGIWTTSWERFGLTISKGQLDLGSEDGEPDFDIVCQWMGRFAAAVVAILPLEEENQIAETGVLGYSEGTPSRIATNRYERDRRNRAAAIAIHGSSCKACGFDFGKRYGAVASGYIDVHHVTPLSQLGPDYIIDPKLDLIPLCPNCHAVAHRRNPPYTIDEIAFFLETSLRSN